MSDALIKPALRGATPYAAPTNRDEGDLLLDLNEGAPLIDAGLLRDSIDAIGVAGLRRYPDASGLEAALSSRLGVDAARVIVTNGGDDAIDRVCRLCIEPGDNAVIPSPSFEMIARSVGLSGGEVRRAGWLEGAYPIDAVLGACDERTRLVAVVSPNNPTGSVIDANDLDRLARSLPGVLILVDLAYTEFADVDLTHAARLLPNTVLVRTFSKAYGLAGLRVGYAIGSVEVIAAMRSAGGPFPCSSVSLEICERALAIPVDDAIKQIRAERDMLRALLARFGVESLPSQANFVLARFGDAQGVWQALSESGVRVRRFADPALSDYLRIGCPGNASDMRRLSAALEGTLRICNEAVTETKGSAS